MVRGSTRGYNRVFWIQCGPLRGLLIGPCGTVQGDSFKEGAEAWLGVRYSLYRREHSGNGEIMTAAVSIPHCRGLDSALREKTDQENQL